MCDCRLAQDYVSDGLTTEVKSDKQVSQADGVSGRPRRDRRLPSKAPGTGCLGCRYSDKFPNAKIKVHKVIRYLGTWGLKHKVLTLKYKLGR